MVRVGKAVVVVIIKVGQRKRFRNVYFVFLRAHLSTMETSSCKQPRISITAYRYIATAKKRWRDCNARSTNGRCLFQLRQPDRENLAIHAGSPFQAFQRLAFATRRLPRLGKDVFFPYLANVEGILQLPSGQIRKHVVEKVLFPPHRSIQAQRGVSRLMSHGLCTEDTSYNQKERKRQQLLFETKKNGSCLLIFVMLLTHRWSDATLCDIRDSNKQPAMN